MSENVAQAIAGRAESLYEKMASNQALSNLIMGFLSNMVITCAKQGKAVAGVRCGSVSESLGDFRFKVEYLPVALATSSIWSPSGDDLKRYVASKSAQLARCFEVNPTLIRTFSGLVTAIDNYCKHKRIAFKDFKIKKAYITPTDIFVLRSGENSLDGFKGRGNY